MAERNLEHSQKIQSDVLKADITESQDGRRYGFGALALLIIAALVCAYLNKEALALAFLGTGALGVIGQFIKGRQQNDMLSDE